RRPAPDLRAGPRHRVHRQARAARDRGTGAPERRAVPGDPPRGLRERPVSADARPRAEMRRIVGGMIQTTVSRRAFLRGAGAMVALPALESFGATAGPRPRRLAVLYTPNGVNVPLWT